MALNTIMRTAIRWKSAVPILVPALLLGWGSLASAADFALTSAEARRVAQREIIIRADLDSKQRKGTVRAAILIDAAPEIVFGMMTRCADALRYVPHLKECRVRDKAADDSWQLVEHEIDFGWYTPRLRWTFRVDFTGQTVMRFRQVSGDFKANEGAWQLERDPGGARTLLRYRAYIDPPGYVPTWLARSTFRRELPLMLQELRRLCEVEQRTNTPPPASSF
jgi:hypothetical protein